MQALDILSLRSMSPERPLGMRVGLIWIHQPLEHDGRNKTSTSQGEL